VGRNKKPPRRVIAQRLSAFRALSSNKPLARVHGSHALFVLTECAVWIAMLIYAYGHGGAAVAGIVAVAQLVPAALLAPVAAAASDRRSPVALLTTGYVVQAAGMAATGLAIALRMPIAAYGAAVVASTAVATTRPAQAAIVPSVSVTADELTAANVVAGWLEAAGLAVAGSFVGLLIWLSGLASVFAVCAALAVVAALLVAKLPVPALSPLTAAPSRSVSSLREVLSLVAARRGLRSMLALLTAAATVAGAVDLLIVLLAIKVLGGTQALVGYLNAAYGAGAVVAATVSAMLVGRRLGQPVLGAALLLAGALVALALEPGLAGTIVLLAVIGASGAILGIATRTLLQRSVPPHLISAVFGVVEGLCMAGLAAGALLVPLLLSLGGVSLALAGIAALVPLAVAAFGRSLFRLDAEATVPVVEIALLRSLPLFAELPAQSIERVAAALTAADLHPGAVLIEQGADGDVYYAIAAGEFDVLQDGQHLRTCGRGDGVGEIALLRQIPRSASVIARTTATVYELKREPFLLAVLGHTLTHRRARSIVEARLSPPEQGLDASQTS
jgi:hypothetical protein